MRGGMAHVAETQSSKGFDLIGEHLVLNRMCLERMEMRAKSNRDAWCGGQGKSLRFDRFDTEAESGDEVCCFTFHT